LKLSGEGDILREGRKGNERKLRRGGSWTHNKSRVCGLHKKWGSKKRPGKRRGKGGSTLGHQGEGKSQWDRDCKKPKARWV